MRELIKKLPFSVNIVLKCLQRIQLFNVIRIALAGMQLTLFIKFIDTFYLFSALGLGVGKGNYDHKKRKKCNQEALGALDEEEMSILETLSSDDR